MALCKERSKFPLLIVVHNRQPKLTAPKVHYAVPFCIAPCPVHLVGSAVVEHNLVLEPDDD